MGNGFLVTRRGKADKIAKKAVAKKRAAPRKKKAVKKEEDEMDGFIDEDNDDDSDECVSFESVKGREVVFEEAEEAGAAQASGSEGEEGEGEEGGVCLVRLRRRGTVILFRMPNH